MSTQIVQFEIDAHPVQRTPLIQHFLPFTHLAALTDEEAETAVTSVLHLSTRGLTMPTSTKPVDTSYGRSNKSTDNKSVGLT